MLYEKNTFLVIFHFKLVSLVNLFLVNLRYLRKFYDTGIKTTILLIIQGGDIKLKKIGIQYNKNSERIIIAWYPLVEVT